MCPTGHGFYGQSMHLSAPKLTYAFSSVCTGGNRPFPKLTCPSSKGDFFFQDVLKSLSKMDSKNATFFSLGLAGCSRLPIRGR